MEASDAGGTFTLALRNGIMLADRYRVDGVLAGASSFAVTYVATDEEASDAANPSVVVKEFLPRFLVGRGNDGVIVQPHSPTAAREFSRALRGFIREGDTIAEMTNPNLIRVHRTLEANGTGYLVMQHSETVALTDALSDAGGKLPPADSVLLVKQVLGALEAIHAEGIFHRAISPASVSVMEGWEILLHGFTAQRHITGQIPELIPGFAAIEQYSSRDVGPWTDVYSATALLYYLITGMAPPAAIDRAAGTPLPSITGLVPGISEAVAAAISRGLALLPEQRPSSAAEVRKMLDGTPTSVPFVATPVVTAPPSPPPSLDLLPVSDEIVPDVPIALELAAGGRLVLPRDDGGEPTTFIQRLGSKVRGWRPAFNATGARGKAAGLRISEAKPPDVLPLDQPEPPTVEPLSVWPVSIVKIEIEPPELTESHVEVQPPQVLEPPTVEPAAVLVRTEAVTEEPRAEKKRTGKGSSKPRRRTPAGESTPPRRKTKRAGTAASETTPELIVAEAPQSEPPAEAPLVAPPEPPFEAPRLEDAQPEPLFLSELPRREAPRADLPGIEWKQLTRPATIESEPAIVQTTLVPTPPDGRHGPISTLELLGQRASVDVHPEAATTRRTGGGRRMLIKFMVVAMVGSGLVGAARNWYTQKREADLRDLQFNEFLMGAAPPAQADSAPARRVADASGPVLQGTNMPATDSSTSRGSNRAPAPVAEKPEGAKPRAKSTPSSKESSERERTPDRSSTRASSSSSERAANTKSRSREEGSSKKRTSEDKPATSRLPTLANGGPASVRVDMSKPTVPVDVVTDLRARLAKGKEEVDRGRYALARQAFRSALKAVDSVIIEYLDSDTLRRIRGEIDAADRQALRACQAENDAIRKRGATLLSCD